MPCDPDVLKNVPLFALLDNEEMAVLAAQVELRQFAPRQRIYKIGDAGGRAYVVASGLVRVTTLDEDQQEVIVDETGAGDFFGFASMIERTTHQTSAVAIEETVCVEVDRDDITALLTRKPHAGVDLLTTLGRQIHAAQHLVRLRASRNANVLIETRATFGERVADSVARLGGSWGFIFSFGVMMAVYVAINVRLRGAAWDPYPFILLNLFLSLLAAIQAPVIMMSQNRQDEKDRLRSELDFEVNRRAESEIQGLSRKLHFMAEQVSDLQDLIRDSLSSRRPS